MRVPVLVLVGILAAAASASAQSLADVARKESDRREVVKGSGKTYTNSDLKSVPQPKDAVAEPAATDPADATKSDDEPAAKTAEDAPDAKAGADAAAKPDASKDGAAKETRDQAWWSKRMADLKEQLERDQTFREALQNRIDALSTDFVNRDDPAQRNVIANDRQKALAELERVKKAIEEGRKAIPALEEEARREGVPAGWLR